MTKYPDSPSRLETPYQSTHAAATKPAASRPTMPVRKALTMERGQDSDLRGQWFGLLV